VSGHIGVKIACGWPVALFYKRIAKFFQLIQKKIWCFARTNQTINTFSSKAGQQQKANTWFL
jgi:hypothetical protein